MYAKAMCYSCLLSKYDKLVKNEPDELKNAKFLRDVCKIMVDYGEFNASPYLSMKADELYEELYGPLKDYDEIKEKYNAYMLSREKTMEDNIRQSDDLIAACVKYVCAGNYIDFGTLENVDDTILNRILEKANSKDLQLEELDTFKKDLEKANKLVYLTDNCGEVVCDKIFIKIMKEVYPHLDITCIVRGENVINDATIEDAKSIGLTNVCKVIGNGNRAPSTILSECSEEAVQIIKEADVIISKGQGNFEGMYGENLNTYFFFLCKCQLFVKRFGLKQFSSVFAREDHIKVLF